MEHLDFTEIDKAFLSGYIDPKETISELYASGVYSQRYYVRFDTYDCYVHVVDESMDLEHDSNLILDYWESLSKTNTPIIKILNYYA